MLNKSWNKLLASVVITVAIAVLGVVTACSPSADNSTSSDYSPNPNVSVVMGEYETIGEDPDMLADGTSGTSIHEGAGDETLQQDRVSGGANTGGVASENLDPLEDSLILPQSFENPAPQLTEVGYPQYIPHELEGRDDCASCHEASQSERPMPSDHVKAGISSNLCLECHKSLN